MEELLERLGFRPKFLYGQKCSLSVPAEFGCSSRLRAGDQSFGLSLESILEVGHALSHEIQVSPNVMEHANNFGAPKG